MRFGLVHRVMTDALAALGVIALVASGQFAQAVNVVLIVGMAIAVSLRERWRVEAAKRHIDTIALVLLIAVQLGRAVFGGAGAVELLIEFAVGLQIIRVATRRGAAHDQQVIVLALLHLIAGTVVGGGLAYGLCFIGLLVVTPGALVLSHLRREVEGNYRQGARDRTGLPVDVPRILRSKRVVGRQFIAVTCLLAVPILLFTISLFVVFPRVGLSLLLLNRPRMGRMVGFSGKVDLGQIGTLRTDPTIALRIKLPKTDEPPQRRLVLHLRGTALDAYDGRTWTQSSPRSRIVATAGEAVGLDGPVELAAKPTMQVELEPIEPPVLFVPPQTAGLRLLKNGAITPGGTAVVLKGPEGELRYQTGGGRGARYEIYQRDDGRPTYRRLHPTDRARYLLLPADLPPRVRALARSWAADADSSLEQALAIQQRLRTDFRYDLSSPSGEAEQPLDHFLFESRRGHCEYYSTAMAVLLRVLGVPTRNVTGFVGGTYNRFGEFYAVRQGDAHSWVEAYIDGRGWETFDPTPPAAATPWSEVDGALAAIRDLFEAVSQRWNQHVLGYDLRQQVGLLDAVNTRWPSAGRVLRGPRWRQLLALAGVVLVAGGIYLYRRRRRRQEASEAPGGRPASKNALLATSLYELLDRAMVPLGAARSPTTPPLRHAEMLLRRAHPEADEILELTERYLAARFGDEPLSMAERKTFEQRILRLRSHRSSSREPPTSVEAGAG